MKTHTLIPTTLAAGVLLTGCLLGKEEDSVKATAKARFDIQAVSEASAALAKVAADSGSLTMVDAAGLTFHVSEARAFVGRIKLKTEDDCDDSVAVLVKAGDSSGTDDDSTGTVDCDDSRNSLVGPFIIDLVTGATTPSMGDLTVEAGTYKKVKFHLDHAQKSDGMVASSDPLMDHTLHVKGTYQLPGSASETPFTLTLKFNEEVEMESLGGMVLAPSTLSTILVRIRMDGWLDGLRIGDCLNDSKVKNTLASGVLIDEDSELGKCLDVEKTVKRNIRASFEVERDNSGKGSI